MSNKKVCVEVIADGKESRIRVAGKANKNKTAMENKVGNLSGKLAEAESSAKGDAQN